MADISYLRAGAACVPFFGLFVSAYNMREVDQELSRGASDALRTSLEAGLTAVEGVKAAAAGKINEINAAQEKLETQKDTFQNKYLSIHEKSRIYSICGIVGSALSIVLVVHLKARGILNKQQALGYGPPLTLITIIMGYNLYKHNKVIKLFQKP